MWLEFEFSYNDVASSTLASTLQGPAPRPQYFRVMFQEYLAHEGKHMDDIILKTKW